MSTISRVFAREVLDSRGNPTVEVDVLLTNGAFGRASVPSGASTGASEAVELRDGDAARFRGRGVTRAVDNICAIIAPKLIGRPALGQEILDQLLVELDASENKGRLGANAILGVSLAIAHAAARSEGRSLYAYLGRGQKPLLPVPMLNIINGGSHAAGSTDFQEFMVVPAGFNSFRRALQAGVEVYQALKEILRSKGHATGVGDEGGFTPSVSLNHQAVELVLAAIEKAGYVPGTQCFIALDVAASGLLQKGGGYYLPREKLTLSAEQLINLYEGWVSQYPIISIEDGITEGDWGSWQKLSSRLGNRVQLVGDDLFTTNTTLIHKGIALQAGNAVLIKPNQIGTLSETLAAVRMVKEAGWGTVVSHRSGETEDTTIADLAVATAAGQIKTGAPARGERTAKYNRLLRIEEELGDQATFAGSSVYERFTH